ncbi:unnamed protein product, partial [Phaeothamnion confervicola]
MLAHGASQDELSGLRVLESSINLLAEDDVDALIAEIRLLEIPNLVGVIVDTLNRAMPGGDENASEDMGRMIAAGAKVKNALGVFFMFVHHAGKNETRGARGHSSLKAATDFELLVKRSSGQTREVVAEKVRDGEDSKSLFSFQLESIEVEYDVNGEAITSCAVKEVDNGQASDAPTGLLSLTSKVMLDCLQTALDDRSLHIVADPSDVKAGAATDQLGVFEAPWRKEFYSRHPDKSPDTNK